MRITRQILGLAAASLFGIVPQLKAQAIHFSGYTTGCFYFGPVCVPPIAPGVANDGDLQFVSAGFDGTTSAGGFLGIGIGGLHGSFGTFGLGPNTEDFSGDGFALRVFFTLPTAPDAIFDAVILGDVTFPDAGGVNISFGPPKTLPFVAGGLSGTFSLSIADLNLAPGQHAVPVTGNIRAHVVSSPEPASIALFATGLVGMIPVARYSRRKSAK